jgi:hypothetical protein
MITDNASLTARLATLDQLLETTIPVFLSPTPSRETLRNWFDAAGIPRFKSNPSAQRGGGPVFYSVGAVEKFFRSRTLPGGAMLRARGPVMG